MVGDRKNTRTLKTKLLVIGLKFSVQMKCHAKCLFILRKTYWNGILDWCFLLLSVNTGNCALTALIKRNLRVK